MQKLFLATLFQLQHIQVLIYFINHGY